MIANQPDQRRDAVTNAFAPLIGLPGWHVRKGHGSFITFEFGNPRLVIRDPMPAPINESQLVRRTLARRRIHVRGDWHLWIYCCNWRLVLASQDGCHSESADWEMKAALQDLDGQRLMQVEIASDRGSSIFRFDLGAALETWPYVAEMQSREMTEDHPTADEQWLLYAPSRRVFTYDADGACRWRDSDQAS